MLLRSFFIALSHNQRVRGWAEQTRVGRGLASRFVAGTTIEEAIGACERVNAQGMRVSLDSLGESVTEESEARAAAEIYHRLLDEIAQRGLDANVSLKLSQMGSSYGLGHTRACAGDAEAGIESDGLALAEEVVGGVVEHAARVAGFVRIDMEGSETTEATLALTERLHARWPGSVGTVLQAYLYRTGADVERLLGQGIRIRLCKGAYKEGPSVAFARKADVDANYAKLMMRMVTSGVFCGVATHDERLIEEMLRFVRERGVAKSGFEFQMLYGVRRDLQRRLVAEGYGVRVYVPFGTAWYPYFMRRLAERPANVLFLARNLSKA
jgi:proline dehydrogenase